MDMTTLVIVLIFGFIAGLLIYGAIADERDRDTHDYWH